MIQIKQAFFQKEGKTITYRQVSLTEKGQKAFEEDLNQLKLTAFEVKSSDKKMKQPKKTSHPGSPLLQSQAFEKLKLWRLEMARKKGAFPILSDRALAAICEVQPKSEIQFMDIKEIGPKTARIYFYFKNFERNRV